MAAKKERKEVLYIIILILLILLGYVLKEFYALTKSQSTQTITAPQGVNYVVLDEKVARGSKTPYFEGYYCPKMGFTSYDYLYFPPYDYKHNQGYFFNSELLQAFLTKYSYSKDKNTMKMVTPGMQFTNEIIIDKKTDDNLILAFSPKGSPNEGFSRFCPPDFFISIPQQVKIEKEIPAPVAPLEKKVEDQGNGELRLVPVKEEKNNKELKK